MLSASVQRSSPPLLTSPFEAIVSLPLARDFLRHLQARLGSMRSASRLPVNQPQLAVQAQLPHLYPDQFAAFQFALHADLRQKGHAVSHRHKSLDRLQCRKLNIHVQWSLVVPESLNYLLAVRRADNVRDERFLSKLLKAYLRL